MQRASWHAEMTCRLSRCARISMHCTFTYSPDQPHVPVLCRHLMLAWHSVLSHTASHSEFVLQLFGPDLHPVIVWCPSLQL